MADDGTFAPMPPPTTGPILGDIAIERQVQIARHGRDSHPDVPPYGDVAKARWAEHWAHHADQCRRRRVTTVENGQPVTWLDVVDEEVAELVEAAWKGNRDVVRAEALQVIAALMAWIEDIDRGP
jgi:hypothetical protein